MRRDRANSNPNTNTAVEPQAVEVINTPYSAWIKQGRRKMLHQVMMTELYINRAKMVLFMCLCVLTIELILMLAVLCIVVLNSYK
jgi:hypothetical protein